MNSTRTTETVAQKITAILTGALLVGYAVVFAVQGVGPYLA